MINSTNYRLRKENIDKRLSLIDRLLESRDLTAEQLSMGYEDLFSPYLINDMDKAVERIERAIKNKEKTIIYGDYDVDGIMATITLKKGLAKLGLNCDYYIPARLIDGYGMNMNSVFDIMAEDYALVITVDCGITGIKEIGTLQDSGIDVVLTDHHECHDFLPNAYAVLDNKRKDNTYPFPDICGAGMAFKLLTALFEKFGMKGEERKFLKYTALATVCDVMPLINENRVFVNEGLAEIKSHMDTSFKNILRVAGKLENPELLKAEDIAFYVGPLINASSRVGDVKYAVELFLTEDEETAINNADLLRKFNEQRKEIEKLIFEEAQKQIIAEYNFASFAPIVVYGDNWHKGVIGIVASRISERFDRPVVILSRPSGEKVYHGSCRSYGDIDMMSILRYAKDYIIQFGGHTGAAGLTVSEEKLPAFINKLKEYALNNFTQSMFFPVKTLDLEIFPNEITLENYESLMRLEPFGEKNEEPVFVCRNLRTKNIKKIGTKKGFENAHLSISFSPEDDALTSFNGVGFFMSEYADILPAGRIVDVVFKLASNTWKDVTKIQLMVQDIIYSPVYKDGLTEEEDELYRDNIVTIKNIEQEYGVSKDELLPTKNEYIAVFKMINVLLTEPNNSIIITNLNYLTSVLSTRLNHEFNPFKISRILEALGESNNITYKNLMFDQILISAPLENKPKQTITSTNAYKKNHGIN